MKLKMISVLTLCAASTISWAQVPQQVGNPNGAPPPAVAPLTNAEKMASPPRVSFTGGELTVIADNSNMQEVLDAIHGATGSQFDVQRDSGSSRVFGKFGPGPVSTVVGQILRGGGISYILVSSPSNPGGLQRAMLMGKAAPPPVVTAQPNQQPPNNGEEEAADPNQYEGDDSSAQPEPSLQQQLQQQQQYVQQPVGVNGVQGNNGAPQNGVPTGTTSTKTPEQLLQELQQIRLQQIQQIQQQQQRGGVPPPASAQPQQ